MTPYILNLTNDLIRRYRFDAMGDGPITKDIRNNWERHIALSILDSVEKMNPETLGRIMCSFDVGDVLSYHPGKEVPFGGDCEELLRDLVAFCLAQAILQRIAPLPGYTPPLTGMGRGTMPPVYKRKVSKA